MPSHLDDIATCQPDFPITESSPLVSPSHAPWAYLPYMWPTAPVLDLWSVRATPRSWGQEMSSPDLHCLLWEDMMWPSSGPRACCSGARTAWRRGSWSWRCSWCWPCLLAGRLSASVLIWQGVSLVRPWYWGRQQIVWTGREESPWWSDTCTPHSAPCSLTATPASVHSLLSSWSFQGLSWHYLCWKPFFVALSWL